MRRSFLTLALLLLALTFAALYSATVDFRDFAVDQTSLNDLVSVRAPLAEAGVAQSAAGDVSSQEEPNMAELVELARHLLANMRANVRDYSATLVKRERIMGNLAPEARMEIKIRNPQVTAGATSSTATASGPSAYLKFIEPASQRGREVIWVADKNDNKLIAHQGGFLNLMRVELDPHGTLAMIGNKYPITEIGLVRLLEKMLEKIDRNVDLSRCTIETREHQRVGDRDCRLIQVTQPRSVPGADFYIAQFFLDTERQLPLRYAAFLWPEKPGAPPPLEEEYTYLDLETNVGLSDADFDPDNPDYDFP